MSTISEIEGMSTELGVQVETVKPIPYAWQRWAAAQIVRSVPVEEVIGGLVGAGFERGPARVLLTDLVSSPFAEAARSAADRLGKLESVLTVRQQLRDLSAAGSQLEVRSELSAEEFLGEYYSANLPVLLSDVSAHWPALEVWSPQYLASVLGDEPVEVMANRESDRRFEINCEQHKTTMPFSDYVAYVVSAACSNDAYLVANNHLLERAAAAPLWDDFTIDARYLDESRTSGQVFLWFGPAGTMTPLHHDVANVLFVQVYGRKRIRLVSPLESHCVYNDVGVYSEVDAAEPDLAAHPLFAKTRPFDVVINPGQALFLPVGWWHHVVAIDTSISVSFTNFRWPNSYPWHHPNIWAT